MLLSHKATHFRNLIFKFGFIFLAILIFSLLTTQNVHSSDFTLVWNFPEELKSQITGYRIFYRKKSEDFNELNKQEAYDPYNTTYTIAISDSDPNYCFSVMAFDDVSGSESAKSDEVCNYSQTNSPPVAYNQSVITDEDKAISIKLTSSDTDLDPLTYSIVTQPSHGTLSGTPPDVTYQPIAKYSGVDSFTFKTNNGVLDSNIGTITITINPVNIPFESRLIGWWRFDDMNGTLAYDSSNNGNDGQLYGPIWTSGKIDGGVEFDGIDDNVDVGMFDVTGSGITISTWINAYMYSHLPYHDARIISKSTGVGENDHYWMLSTTKSGENTRLRFRLKSDGSTKTLVASSGDLTTGVWIHAVAVYDGSTMKLYKDGELVGSTTKTGTISTNKSVPVNIGRNPDGLRPWYGIIDDVRIYNYALSESEILELANPVENYAPVVYNKDVIMKENTSTAIMLSATDADGDELSYSIYSYPSYGKLSGIGPNVTYSLTSNYNGIDSFTFWANDGELDSNIGTITIIINPVNDDPVANDDIVITDENTVLSITLTGTDVDGDILTYMVVNQPSHGVLSGTAPSLTYIPDTNYAGTDSFTFKVNDGVADSNTATVSITIYRVEDPPLTDCTIYEDAEDGNKNGWIIYNKDPKDAWITNVFDTDRQSWVIELGSVSNDYCYLLRDVDGLKWRNSSQFLARWSMKYSDYFAVYFDVHTTSGNKYLYYTPIDFDALGQANYVHHGLGSKVTDGQWYSFERDLQADLEEAQSGVSILYVTGFMIYGGGRVDDIELCTTHQN